jgi:hypothetical protein
MSGTIAANRGDETAAATLEEGLRLGREFGLPTVVDRALNNLGTIATAEHRLADPRSARRPPRARKGERG